MWFSLNNAWNNKADPNWNRSVFRWFDKADHCVIIFRVLVCIVLNWELNCVIRVLQQKKERRIHPSDTANPTAIHLFDVSIWWMLESVKMTFYTHWIIVMNKINNLIKICQYRPTTGAGLFKSSFLLNFSKTYGLVDISNAIQHSNNVTRTALFTHFHLPSAFAFRIGRNSQNHHVFWMWTH